MPDYRVYPIDGKGHIVGPATILTCDEAEEATQQAKALLNGHDLEVWHGANYVGRFNRRITHPSRSDAASVDGLIR
jgi:hypothetical protein